MPQVMGLTKPSGGGGSKRELLQQLRHECWIVRNPVAHHDAATWFCDPDHLPGDIERPGCEHGAEHREGQIKRMIADSLQVARIALLEFQLREARLAGS